MEITGDSGSLRGGNQHLKQLELDHWLIRLWSCRQGRYRLTNPSRNPGRLDNALAQPEDVAQQLCSPRFKANLAKVERRGGFDPRCQVVNQFRAPACLHRDEQCFRLAP